MAVLSYATTSATSHSSILLVLCGSCAAALLLLWYKSRQRHSIAQVRGPPVKNAIMGNIRDLSYQESVGDLDFEYLKEYGTAWRMQSTLGKPILVLSDPKGLQHVLHKSGYLYPKTTQSRIQTLVVTGRSILWAPHGDTHSRHRKIMNPAFSAPQLRSFLPLFRKSSGKLCQLWKDQVHATEGTTILINNWLARTTLDVVGEAAFDYDFGALDNKDDELSKAYENMFTDATLYPSAWNAVFQAFWDYLPERVLEQVRHIPTREYARTQGVLRVFAKYSRRLIAQKNAALASDRSSRDVLSILVRANASEDAKSRLSDEEMVSQMGALTLAGHETTANTITWMLYELARHPEYQGRMHAEIVAKRAEVAARGDADFSMEDLEALEHLQAAIKETLRYHPIAYLLNRMASEDDTIPLAYPIRSTKGELLSEIPITKGQAIAVNIAAYNRLPEVWGQDAHVWNPMRFIEGKADPQIRVGMFGNLMSFSAGVRGCIGWRFSIIEMQAIVTDLVENFRFTLPKDMPEIIRVPAAVMVPMIKGKQGEGCKLPLHVTPY
ncbi:cytochrome P450 [Phanerochaete sordida]|uniref:Cytochrome P450 n=1 Tax=Phanerochaete sordida TaxID=48140 RepID=A0A9P3GM86_9APHY|nr:cytochrome P450 [Phanerochaete sordida]